MIAEIVSINQTKVPPKIFKLRHKGLSGTITYDPESRVWHWRTVMIVKVPQEGTEPTEDKAREALKRILDTAATAGNNVTTTE